MKPLVARLWPKIKIGPPDECWLWLAACAGPIGHQRPTIGRGGRKDGKIIAQRAVWEVTFGAIPNGLEVCHTCDNELCCNPRHFYLGTHKQNMMDMARKQRSPRRRLTAEQILTIRKQFAEGGITKTDLGKQFGVSRVQIANIVSGAHWAWLQ